MIAFRRKAVTASVILGAAAMVFFLLSTTTAFSEAKSLFEYAGGFPADHPQDVAVGNYMLIDRPRQVRFELCDKDGKSLSDLVKIVEVTLTSNTAVSFKNENGFEVLDLPEPGIYEVKAKISKTGNSPIEFVLKVYDTGNVPATPSSNAAQILANTPVSRQAPITNQIATTDLTATSTAVVESIPPTVNTNLKNEFSAFLVMPDSNSYADPFKPIEISFDKEFSTDISPESCMEVAVLNAQGNYAVADGKYFFAGSKSIRFIPSKLINGAVYYVKVRDPLSKAEIASFSFSTFPEANLNLSYDNANNLKVTIAWPQIPDLMPSAEGQVVKLNHSRLSIKAQGTELATINIDSTLPPFGNIDGIECRAQPWRLEILIPREKIGEEIQKVEAVLSTRIFGIENMLDVSKAAITVKQSTESKNFPIASSQQISSATLPADDFVSVSSETSPSPATFLQPSIAASETVNNLIAAATLSVATDETKLPVKVTDKPTASAPTPETVELKPVTPIPDLGPDAACTALGRIPSAEEKQKSALSWPKGIAWSFDGTLWTVDSQERHLLRFLDDGRLLTLFGKKGKGPGMLGLPIEVAVASNGIFVSDTAAHTVHHYDENGNFVCDIGTWGTKPGQLDLPHGVCIENDNLWIADRGNSRIDCFSLNGKYIGGFGKKGELDEYLAEPVGIRVKGGSAWVLNAKNGRVQEFKLDGKFVKAFNTNAKEATALELDPWGYIWIADSEGHQVMRFDSSGRLLMTLLTGSNGRRWYPTSVAVRADGLVAIADGESKIIHVYKLEKAAQ